MNQFSRIERYKDEINEGKAIAIIWTTDDVMSQAKDEGKAITEDKAIEVLGNIDHRHDAGIGINWDVISCHLDMADI